jgi:hypothetical protein
MQVQTHTQAAVAVQVDLERLQVSALVQHLL